MKKYTKEEAITIINDAIKQMNIEFISDNPDSNHYAVKLIREQVQYVKDAFEHRNDRSKLHNTAIGLLTVREIEPMGYRTLVKLLYSVDSIADLMQKHKSNGETWL